MTEVTISLFDLDKDDGRNFGALTQQEQPYQTNITFTYKNKSWVTDEMFDGLVDGADILQLLNTDGKVSADSIYSEGEGVKKYLLYTNDPIKIEKEKAKETAKIEKEMENEKAKREKEKEKRKAKKEKEKEKWNELVAKTKAWETAKLEKETAKEKAKEEKEKAKEMEKEKAKEEKEKVKETAKMEKEKVKEEERVIKLANKLNGLEKTKKVGGKRRANNKTRRR